MTQLGTGTQDLLAEVSDGVAVLTMNRPARRNAISAAPRRLARGPRLACRYMKENLSRAVAGELGECMDIEATHHVRTG